MAADRVGEMLGNYTLLRLLGQGTFAEVYLGEHRYLERPAAIKVLHVRMQRAAAHNAFHAEAKLIARLQHPHLVSVLDFGIEGETPYLVMDYAPNGTLRSRHPRGTLLSFEQIISYVKQIASALDYAHTQHIIHRDIKPDNLLLNAKDEIVVSDFGIAVVERTLDSLSTQDRAGTPLYMAPEQIEQHPCAASDQYAVGVMVYEWLCGAPPFPGPGLAIFAQHLYQEPPSLRERVPDLPQAVEDAVFGALAKDPGQRFASVGDFAQVLEEAFFATQPLSFYGSLEQKVQKQSMVLPSHLPVVPVPSLDVQGSSAEAIQPRQSMQEPVASSASRSMHHSQDIAKPAKLSVAQTNRQRLLRRVRSFWITGVLEQSLHGAALMALGLKEQPDAVTSPWHLVIQQPKAFPQSLPMGTRITEVYDRAEGDLLILGAPGSGKTTLLLELARDLLERAECEVSHLMPVVFNLSSWATKQRPLTDWLTEELSTKYQVPRKLAQTLITTEQILPLLDGLDEVAPNERTACIEAINRYRQDHGLLPLVVCSRSADYLAQTGRVQMGTAVMVQPLTNQQVDVYLASGGEPLWALRVALHQDASLRELTQTPLMLSLLTLTYHDLPVEGLLRATSPQAQQRQIFEQYVQRMLLRQGVPSRYTSQQTMHWFTQLARRLKRQRQTEFSLEQLQPDWLPRKWLRLAYQALSNGLFVGLIAGLSIGLLVGLVIGIAVDPLIGIILGFICALTSGLVSGLMGGFISILKIKETSARGKWFWERVVRSGVMFLIWGFFIMFAIQLLRPWFTQVNHTLIRGWLYGLPYGSVNWLMNWLKVGTCIGVASGLVSGLIGGLLSGTEGEIKPAEVLIYSWKNAQRSVAQSLRLGVIVGLLILLIDGLLVVLSDGLVIDVGSLLIGFIVIVIVALKEGGLDALAGMIIVSLLSFLFRGVSKGILDEQRRTKPNQGIWRSGRNGLLIGSFSGLLSGAIFILLSGRIFGLLGNLTGGVTSLWFDNLVSQMIERLLNEPIARVVGSVTIAVIVGCIGWLGGGGVAYIKHFVLRFFLSHIGYIPMNYSKFLNYGVERVLLRKVGGGYIFVHRLLLEYFADLDTTTPACKSEDSVKILEVNSE